MISGQPCRILIAGVGNPLRQDDAFGVELINRLIEKNLFSSNVILQEVGIGGIHLVQELHSGYDVLILLDAVEWNLKPGEMQMRVIDSVQKVEDMPKDERRDFLADMHYTNPVRAMMLAQSLNVLPTEVYIFGCQAKYTDGFEIGMSPEVLKAIPKGVDILRDWVNKYLENWI